MVDDIVQLGHMPTQRKEASHEEKLLACRLSKARKERTLTREQEAVLDKVPQASRMGYGKRNSEKLVEEILELGHVPTQANTASAKEKKAREASEVCTHGGLVDKGAGSSFGQACAGKQDEK